MVSVILFLLLYARVGVRLWRACQRDRGQGHPNMAVGILEAAAGQIATATRRTSMLRIWTPGACQQSSDRKSVVWGKRGSVSVDLGGRRTITTKQKIQEREKQSDNE